MKPKFLIAFLLLCGMSFSSFAQKTSQKESTKFIILTDDYTSLIIKGLNVVLIDGDDDKIKLVGDEKDIKGVSASCADGHLTISYQQLNSNPDVTVYMPARQLKRIIVEDNSTLATNTILQNKKLDVVMNGEGKVNLRSLGKIRVEAEDGIEFVKP